MAAGWRAAAWASATCLAATIVILGRWLIDLKHPPAAAFLFLVYAPTVVLGRIGMSDVPSAAVVTAGLWLLWTGAGRSWKSFAAGLLAGLSLLFRETNALIVFPFVVGAVVRRQAAWTWLAAGAALGIAARLLIYQLLFASPLFIRSPEGWSLAAALDSLPVYAFALLVMVPGGLCAIVTYRGERRGELIAAVALYVAVYIFYVYSGQSSQPGVRLAVAGRYLIPLVPLIVVAWADMAGRRTWPLQRLLPAAAATALAGSIFIHPVLHWWGRREAAVVRDIVEHTGEGDVLFAGAEARKYISPVYGRHERIWIEDVQVSDIETIRRRYPAAYLVSVMRYDTQAMAEASAETDRFVFEARHACRLAQVLDRDYNGLRRLSLWRIESCNGNGLQGR